MKWIRQATSWDGFWWVIGIAAVLAVASCLSWRYWEDLRGDESLSTTIRNVGLVVGGIVAVILAVWRSRLAEREAAIGQMGLLNERYQKGADMLGSEVLSVRMGGIYALKRLAEEHPKEYAIQILDLLCAFVRHPTKDESIVSQSHNQMLTDEQDEHPREDVQAIMRFIGYRNQATIHLENKYHHKLDLRGADLRNLPLRGANLSGADLTVSRLSGAELSFADLSNAHFLGADLSDVRADRANCSWAQFNGAKLMNIWLVDAVCTNATMFRANLLNANLVGAKLSEAILTDADLSLALLVGADLTETRFVNANLSGTVFDKLSPSDAGSILSNSATSPVKGLTQHQLDSAEASPFNPPELVGVTDAGSGTPLAWRGNSTLC